MDLDLWIGLEGEKLCFYNQRNRVQSAVNYCCHFDIIMGVGHTLKFYIKVHLYVMSKELFGELSCTRTGLVSSQALGRLAQ